MFVINPINPFLLEKRQGTPPPAGTSTQYTWQQITTLVAGDNVITHGQGTANDLSAYAVTAADSSGNNIQIDYTILNLDQISIPISLATITDCIITIQFIKN
jgi:hypothetical protein